MQMLKQIKYGYCLCHQGEIVPAFHSRTSLSEIIHDTQWIKEPLL